MAVMEHQRKRIIVNHDTFNLLAQKFIEGSIERAELLTGLGIKEDDFYGILGGAFELHLCEIASKESGKSMEEVTIKHLENHIRRHGRFHDEPEPPKPKTIEERRKEIEAEIEAILGQGDKLQADALKVFKLQMELISLLEKRISTLEEDIGHVNSRFAVY